MTETRATIKASLLDLLSTEPPASADSEDIWVEVRDIAHSHFSYAVERQDLYHLHKPRLFTTVIELLDIKFAGTLDDF
jgi:hypothetical protein